MPDKIKIMGEEFRIELVDTLDDVESEDEQTLGETFIKESVIKLRYDLSTDATRRVLAHEIMHAILYIQGHFDVWDNENVVQAVSSGMLAVLRDNKDLLPILGLQGVANE